MKVEIGTSLADEVVAAIAGVVGPSPVVLHEPAFTGNEWRYVKDCLDSTFVSSVGRYVDRFEEDLAQYTGAKHAVAVVNGTAALHMALMLAGVGKGDEVLVPGLTFIATANAVSYCGAMPHFVDSEVHTLGIDSAKLRDYLKFNTEISAAQCVNKHTGRVIRAIVPMHTFGHPVDMQTLIAVATDYNLPVVEDAAEALGSYYQGQHVGTFGRAAALSFNGNKTITTGGGGAIITNDSEIARRAKHITTTAKLAHKWEYRHDVIGYNYRMPNLNAALGCAQLEQLPTILAAKRDLFNRYAAAFKDIDGIKLVKEPKNSKSNYWLQTLLLAADDIEMRNLLLETTNTLAYMTRPAWAVIPDLEIYASCPAMDMTCAQSLSRRLLNIPSSAVL